MLDSELNDEYEAPKFSKLTLESLFVRQHNKAKKWDHRVKHAPVGAGLLQSMDILQHELREKQLLRQLETNGNFLKSIG